MVKIEDGYQKRLEAATLYETAHALAKRFFGGRVSPVSKKRFMRDGLSEIVVTYGPKEAVCVLPDCAVVQVNRQEDYEKAFQLANALEGMICKEFTLRTTYRHS